MSRCFPYPPPGYVKNGIRDEALIESIKIQREEKKVKKERKKDKKERKQGKKERDKGRGSGSGEIESKKHGYKKRHKNERNHEERKGGAKIRENEAESIENSTTTEECGQAWGSQNSSDCTLNSNKRQKLSLPPDNAHNPGGSIIRIRLPCQRHKDPEVLPEKEQPCSTSTKIDDDAFVQGMRENYPKPGKELEQHPSSTASTSHPELTSKLNKEKPCSSSFASESLLVRKAEKATMPSNLCSGFTPKLALEFINLVEDWVAPALQTELNSFDEEWLFQKQNLISGVKSNTNENYGPSRICSPTWPHAFYLHEVDIYALPFTIPY